MIQYAIATPKVIQVPKETSSSVPRLCVFKHSACHAGIVEAMKLMLLVQHGEYESMY